MKLYYVSLTFHYSKKKKKMTNFEAPLNKKRPVRPSLNPPLILL